MSSITVEILESTFTWCSSLAQKTVFAEIQPFGNKVDIVEGSFLESKLNGFLPAYHFWSMLGYSFAEGPNKILMLINGLIEQADN